ncbi:hypothetical protein G7K_4680-t1 [Saitoella complicata NRRL Y-17804]|uniref:Rab-GAP TBC domain-containing protein n=1 Tax=Saitoella complicata (strain BCRC 22490 / CBS 7301 / JCM 7358 / NBRC 10748 / NRRL Y-17804) TaxID=698492 RepID=A0A0E9NLK2_SAICN|nr:hypothetical protein G7K_4680-t1 [Saitoella complicata NRRL Y-17804]
MSPVSVDSSMTVRDQGVEDSRESMLSISLDVNWDSLNKQEEDAAQADEDAETAFLLARLEKENEAIHKDPKRLSLSALKPRHSITIAYLRNLLSENPENLRTSLLPPPPSVLTDLDFYAALVADYPSTASKLPNLVSKKLRSGVPPPLRGLVWQSISSSRLTHLTGLYSTLTQHPTPYSSQISRDLSRTFPNNPLFSVPGGEGQQMLQRVLHAFSIYDADVGYCQGLAFVVGPLLMNMAEEEAFCVLVRLMESYDMRGMFTQDLAGLQLRLWQFERLLEAELPEVNAHLKGLGIAPSMYASQWFLSLFAVTCPLGTLHRIYDIIFAEGAPETIMRIALALLKRNASRLLTLSFDDSVTMLLGGGLWRAYEVDDDGLIADACIGLENRVTTAGLKQLKEAYYNGGAPTKRSTATQDLQAVASRFLGRLWGGSTLSPETSRAPASIHMKRSSSKQSVSTTDSRHSGSSEGSTDATTISRNSYAPSIYSHGKQNSTATISTAKEKSTRELEAQLEDLLLAINTLQREHAVKAEELEKTRRERDSARSLARGVVKALEREIEVICDERDASELEGETSVKEYIGKINDMEAGIVHDTHSAGGDEITYIQSLLVAEVSKSAALATQLDDANSELTRLRDSNREMRVRYQEAQREKAKSLVNKPAEAQGEQPGLRKLTLVRRTPSGSGIPSAPETSTGIRPLSRGASMRVNRRTSTMMHQRESYTGNSSLPAVPDSPISGSSGSSTPTATNIGCQSCDSLKLDLANVKTELAVARQMEEEAKARVDTLRKVMSGAGKKAESAAPTPPLVRPTIHVTKSDSVTVGVNEVSEAGPTRGWFGWKS